MTRHYGTDRRTESLHPLSGEELLLMAVLCGAQTLRRVHQELGRRASGSPGSARPKPLSQPAARLRLAA